MADILAALQELDDKQNAKKPVSKGKGSGGKGSGVRRNISQS